MAESNYLHITQEDSEYYVPLAAFFDSKKQDTLVSGTNIKTINNQSLLGSGNIDISGGGGTITVDAELSETSTNPVQNKIITGALSNKQNKITLSDTVAMDQVSVNSVIVRGKDGAGFISRGNGTIKVSDGDSTTPIEVTNLKDGTSDSSAVNKKQLDTKQNKFATLNSTTNSIELDTTYKSITGNSSSVIFTDTTNDLRLTSAGNIELNANKDVYISGTTPTVRSDYYNIVWDSTNEAIKITFKE